MNSLKLAPQFIEPKTIFDMTEQQQTELLDGIRTRRLIAVTQYMQLVEEKKQAKSEAAQIRIGRLSERMAKSIEKIDKELEKLDDFIAKARVIRLEVFDVA